MSELIISFNELKEENNRLLNQLCFERNLNEILENIRINSIVLINSCKCGPNEEDLQKYNESEEEYQRLKTSLESQDKNNTEIVDNESDIDPQIDKTFVILSTEKSGKTCVKLSKNDLNPKSAENLNTDENKGRKRSETDDEDNQQLKTCQTFIKRRRQRPKNVEKEQQLIDELIVEKIIAKKSETKDSEDNDEVKTNKKIVRKRRQKRKCVERPQQMVDDLVVKQIMANKQKVLPKIEDSYSLSMGTTEPKFVQIFSPIPQMFNTTKYYLIPNNVHPCHKCEELFDSEQLLAEHNNDKHPQQYGCPYCKELYNSEEILVLHTYYDHRKHFVFCINCEFCTQNKEVLAKHRTAHDLSQFDCTEQDCRLSFDSYSELIEHRNGIHQSYECGKCDRSFESEISLNSHLNFMHKHFKQALEKTYSVPKTVF